MVQTHTSNITTDHGVIQRWIEERGGRPAVVGATYQQNGGGVLRVDFGDPEENLEEISWQEFFDIFDENDLQFLYQDDLESGQESRFYEFTNR